MMNMVTFKVVFTEMVEHLVERIQSNYALQIIPNSFLANSTTSATFAGILLTFLLQRMDTMGCKCVMECKCVTMGCKCVTMECKCHHEM